MIEFYKGNLPVIDELHEIGVRDLVVSVVSIGELYYGARDKSELTKMRKHLSLMKQIPLDPDISNHFLALLEEYALSHRLSVPDALIAATALSQNYLLYTLNVKDFRFITDLKLYKA
ncbi:MAG: type II toxin-antitoxin system VapC family toxin [Anaerolineae bacterium]|nr:type II toxin-antitoxin system VapC family toxin [Anaerolineae bacterium]